MAKWVEFTDAGPTISGKTRRFEVHSKQGKVHLGRVMWYPQWRKYTFHPCFPTIFEEDCLRDIAQFCEEETRMHYERSIKKSEAR